MSIFHPGSEYRQESLKTILFFFPSLFNTGKPLLRYKTDLKTDCMRVAQFSKKINTEFTLETFQQYFPIKRHWNERERDTPGRASANETDEWSRARTHQAHNDFEHRGSKVIYRRVVRRLISNEKERENWKKKGEKMGEKVGWRAGNSRNPAQYRGNFSAGRIRNLEILSNWIISLAERSNCNRAYQSAISHRSSDYHNSRNSGIVSPWYRSISRYTSSYVCTCLGVRFAVEARSGTNFEKKKASRGDMRSHRPWISIPRRVLGSQLVAGPGRISWQLEFSVFHRCETLIRIRIEIVGSFLSFQERDRMIPFPISRCFSRYISLSRYKFEVRRYSSLYRYFQNSLDFELLG